jgi:hypothetical protein
MRTLAACPADALKAGQAGSLPYVSARRQTLRPGPRGPGLLCNPPNNGGGFISARAPPAGQRPAVGATPSAPGAIARSRPLVLTRLQLQPFSSARCTCTTGRVLVNSSLARAPLQESGALATRPKPSGALTAANGTKRSRIRFSDEEPWKGILKRAKRRVTGACVCRSATSIIGRKMADGRFFPCLLANSPGLQPVDSDNVFKVQSVKVQGPKSKT